MNSLDERTCKTVKKICCEGDISEDERKKHDHGDEEVDDMLSNGENFVILAYVILTQCQHVTDRQMEGGTDRHLDNS